MERACERHVPPRSYGNGRRLRFQWKAPALHQSSLDLEADPRSAPPRRAGLGLGWRAETRVSDEQERDGAIFDQSNATSCRPDNPITRGCAARAFKVVPAGLAGLACRGAVRGLFSLHTMPDIHLEAHQGVTAELRNRYEELIARADQSGGQRGRGVGGPNKSDDGGKRQGSRTHPSKDGPCLSVSDAHATAASEVPHSWEGGVGGDHLPRSETSF